MILRLDESVITQIRSHTIFHSLDLVVRELLQNSLDAGANEITIKIDLSSLSVYIHDNGTGITPDDLEKVTLQHYTSKWHSHNYKGEALFALKAISNLTIISKAPDYTTPFAKQPGGRVVQRVLWRVLPDRRYQPPRNSRHCS